MTALTSHFASLPLLGLKSSTPLLLTASFRSEVSPFCMEMSTISMMIASPPSFQDHYYVDLFALDCVNCSDHEYRAK